MKKIASIILMLLCACSANANPPWKKYVEFPSPNTYEVSMNEIKEQRLCNPAWFEYPNNSPFFLALLSMISSGDEQAFRMGLKIKNLAPLCLDGANLEDFYRASGLFFEQKPKEFFVLGKKEGVSDRTLEGMVVSLPLEYVDQINRQVNALEKRIALIFSLSSTANSTIIEKSLSSLKERLAPIESFD